MKPNRKPTLHSSHKRKPSLYWYGRTEKGWRYLPAPDGTESKCVAEYPQGKFVLRMRTSDGRQTYAAITDQKHPEKALEDATERSETQNTLSPLLNTETRLTGQIRAFLERYEGRQNTEAIKKANEAFRDFKLACPKVNAAKQVTETHIAQFHAWLRAKGNSPRTIFNKHKRMKVFLAFCGVHIDMPMPRFERKEPNAYSHMDITALLQHANEYEKTMILLGRWLGLRERELMHAEFSDIDHSTRTFLVKGKTKYKFTTKTHEQRRIAIPLPLYQHLMAWQKKFPNRSLILGIGVGYAKPPVGLLQRLKKVAKRAAIQDATLHRLRRTFVTELLRSGLNIEDVRKAAGHSNLSTTMLYIESLDAERMVAHVDAMATATT